MLVFSVFILSLSTKNEGSQSVVRFSFFLFFVFFMFVLFSLNYKNPDYENYIYLFNNISDGGEGFITSQIGLVYYFKLITYLGLEYRHALIIMFFMSVFLIHSTIVKYSKNHLFVYVLYFVYPFLLDVVQIKQFFTMAILVYSFGFINHYKNNLFPLFLTFFGSLFHYVAILFIPFYFLRMELKKVFIFSLASVVLISFVVKLKAYEFLIVSPGLSLRIAQYLENGPGLGFLVQVFIQIFLLFLVYKANKRISQSDFSKKILIFSHTVLLLNVYLLILIPFYAINGNFERVYRVMWIPNYVLLTIYASALKIREVVKFSILSLFFVLALSAWYLRELLDLLIEPVFEFNYFFDFFKT